MSSNNRFTSGGGGGGDRQQEEEEEDRDLAPDSDPDPDLDPNPTPDEVEDAAEDESSSSPPRLDHEEVQRITNDPTRQRDDDPAEDDPNIERVDHSAVRVRDVEDATARDDAIGQQARQLEQRALSELGTNDPTFVTVQLDEDSGQLRAALTESGQDRLRRRRRFEIRENIADDLPGVGPEDISLDDQAQEYEVEAGALASFISAQDPTLEEEDIETVETTGDGSDRTLQPVLTDVAREERARESVAEQLEEVGDLAQAAPDHPEPQEIEDLAEVGALADFDIDDLEFDATDDGVQIGISDEAQRERLQEQVARRDPRIEPEDVTVERSGDTLEATVDDDVLDFEPSDEAQEDVEPGLFAQGVARVGEQVSRTPAGAAASIGAISLRTEEGLPVEAFTGAAGLDVETDARLPGSRDVDVAIETLDPATEAVDETIADTVDLVGESDIAAFQGLRAGGQVADTFTETDLDFIPEGVDRGATAGLQSVNPVGIAQDSIRFADVGVRGIDRIGRESGAEDVQRGVNIAEEVGEFAVEEGPDIVREDPALAVAAPVGLGVAGIAGIAGPTAAARGGTRLARGGVRGARTADEFAGAATTRATRRVGNPASRLDDLTDISVRVERDPDAGFIEVDGRPLSGAARLRARRARRDAPGLDDVSDLVTDIEFELQQARLAAAERVTRPARNVGTRARRAREDLSDLVTDVEFDLQQAGLAAARTPRRLSQEAGLRAARARRGASDLATDIEFELQQARLAAAERASNLVPERPRRPTRGDLEFRSEFLADTRTRSGRRQTIPEIDVDVPVPGTPDVATRLRGLEADADLAVRGFTRRLDDSPFLSDTRSRLTQQQTVPDLDIDVGLGASLDRLTEFDPSDVVAGVSQRVPSRPRADIDSAFLADTRTRSGRRQTIPDLDDIGDAVTGFDTDGVLPDVSRPDLAFPSGPNGDRLSRRILGSDFVQDTRTRPGERGPLVPELRDLTLRIDRGGRTPDVIDVDDLPPIPTGAASRRGAEDALESDFDASDVTDVEVDVDVGGGQLARARMQLDEVGVGTDPVIRVDEITGAQSGSRPVAPAVLSPELLDFGVAGDEDLGLEGFDDFSDLDAGEIGSFEVDMEGVTDPTISGDEALSGLADFQSPTESLDQPVRDRVIGTGDTTGEGVGEGLGEAVGVASVTIPEVTTRQRSRQRQRVRRGRPPRGRRLPPIPPIPLDGDPPPRRRRDPFDIEGVKVEFDVPSALEVDEAVEDVTTDDILDDAAQDLDMSGLTDFDPTEDLGL